jgi:hypothetical protein
MPAHHVYGLSEVAGGGYCKEIGGDDAQDAYGKGFPVSEQVWAQSKQIFHPSFF